MKMRKILTSVFLAAFIALTVVCMLFGPAIRDALSQKVACIYPEYLSIDGQMRLSLPKEAVRYDEYGAAYVMTAEVSKKYSERCYEAHKKEVKIYKTDGETVILSHGVQTSDLVIVGGNTADGERVILRSSQI